MYAILTTELQCFLRPGRTNVPAGTVSFGQICKTNQTGSLQYTVRQKNAPLYFCSNFVKTFIGLRYYYYWHIPIFISHSRSVPVKRSIGSRTHHRYRTEHLYQTSDKYKSMNTCARDAAKTLYQMLKRSASGPNTCAHPNSPLISRLSLSMTICWVCVLRSYLPSEMRVGSKTVLIQLLFFFSFSFS